MQETSFTEPAVPVTWEQLGIFVLDASGSMGAKAKDGNLTKAQCLNMAVRETFTRFKESDVREQFYFSNVYFGVDAAMKMPITRADELDDNGDYDPFIQNIDGGGTHIGNGLNIANKIAEEFLLKNGENGVPRTVVIVVLSDGLSEESQTLSIANTIKNTQYITICTTMLEDSTPEPRANQLLQNIASDPVLNYKTTRDAESIRNFFVASASSSNAKKRHQI